ncbi:major facilitator superfamily transporter [Xylariales sp. PMI_506]|nr:major facilitator superfamily transporter [Xylariales sp. PMI_506]
MSSDIARTGSVDGDIQSQRIHEKASTFLSIDKKRETPTEPEKSGFFHWHEPNTSAQEKRLILKLDWFILSYSCLCYFIAWLDSSNISNAYASGMSEELGFGAANELTWMNTYYSIGAMIGAPVSNLLITVSRPRYYLPACLIIWSLFTLFQYKCNTAAQFYGLRFCIGLTDSAAWPGIFYTLGCWYRKSELSRRSALYIIAGVLGQMFSGYLQSALYAGMDGRGGLSAWRWLFIFDFILAIPVAIYGVFCHPDTPLQTKAWYLNEWEKQCARERVEEEGREPATKLNWSILKRIFGSWQVYAFALGFIFWYLTCGSYVMQYFILYLKAEGYPVVQYNNIPTSIGAVNFFFMVGTGYIVDKTRARTAVFLSIGVLMVFCHAIFLVWNVPHALRMVAFIAAGCYGCYIPLMAAWINEVCGADQQKRAFVLAFSNAAGQACLLPYQQLMFPSSQAPHFASTHAWISSFVFTIATVLWTAFGISSVQKWAEKRHKGHIDEERTQ